MSRRRIVTGLDIGTTKICTMIAEITRDNKIEIIGIGLSPSHGLRKGVVVDIDQTSNAIYKALSKAERMAGLEVDSAFVGIAGSHISSINSHGVVAVAGEKKEIQEGDVERVMEAAQIVPLSGEEQIIHVLPREFIVDGCRGIRDPLGMSGVRLEVETHIVTGSSTSVQNLVKSILRAGLSVEEIVLEPLASSMSVLSEDEKELGVALADMGGGTTDVIVFHEGSIAYTSVLPVGGNHVSNDIAVGLRTPINEAEKIKRREGSTMVEQIGEDEYIKVLSASGKNKNEVPRRTLCNVIEPRTREIFNMIRKELEEAGPRDLTPAGLVLTGGGSLLEGTADLASDVVNLPVRLGQPDYVNGLSEVIDNPAYSQKGEKVPKAIFSTAVGLIEYGAEHATDSQSKAKTGELVEDFFRKLKQWFNDFF
ncbi:MAG: cell division protein FtsA [Bacillota bacterium]